MQFTINKTNITEAVSNIQRTVSSKTTIPALEGILIETSDNSIRLSAYDLELGIITAVPANIAEHGKTILSAKIFSDIVRKTPDEVITITVDDKNMATIESGKSQFSIIGISPEEFPEMPKVMDATEIEISSKILKSMIKQTVFAVAESDSKPIHQGSLFNIKDGMLDVVSVDGYRLAKRTEPINIDEDLSFVVSGKTLHEILKLLKDNDENIKIFSGRRHIMFEVENYTVISSLLEGEFLNYNAAIPAESSTEVIVQTRVAINSVERVSLIITDRLKSPVRCTFEDDSIKMLCTTSMGRAKDTINAKIEGNNLEIGFNNRYLLEALKNTECDEIKIKLNGSLSPMTIEPKEGNSFLFLVLPVRLKSE